MSDDFFGQNFSSAPPKQSASLRPRGGAAAARPPPPPPPGRRPVASSSGGAVSSAPNSRSGAPPAPRPRPAARPAARPTTTATRPTATSAASSRPTTTRTAPSMNRPVGSYYGNSSNNASTSASASGQPATTSGNTNYYGASSTATTATPPQVNNSSNNGGFNWGNSAPVPAPAPNQWAAPASAKPASSGNNDDWFSSSTTAPSHSQSTAIPQPTRFGGGAAYGNSSSSLAHSNSNDSLGKYNAADFEGAMDDSAPVGQMQQQQQISTFQPQQYANSTGHQSNNNTGAGDFIDYDNEPPLLEELGIRTDNIIAKTKAVIIPSKRLGGHSHLSPETIVQDADLAGPIAFCLLLGGEMVLTGKLQFGYIYGFALFGCVSMTLVVNLMSLEPISIWTVSSILGYSLLPVNLLACVKIFVMNLINLQRLGRFLGLLTVLWSTTASTRLLELGCGLRDQRYLIAYPLALLYSAFVLITIF